MKRNRQILIVIEKPRIITHFGRSKIALHGTWWGTNCVRKVYFNFLQNVRSWVQACSKSNSTAFILIERERKEKLPTIALWALHEGNSQSAQLRLPKLLVLAHLCHCEHPVCPRIAFVLAAHMILPYIRYSECYIAWKKAQIEKKTILMAILGIVLDTALQYTRVLFCSLYVIRFVLLLAGSICYMHLLLFFFLLESQDWDESVGTQYTRLCEEYANLPCSPSWI